ncbi:cation:proton antiporter [Algihabitans albus]|uniref:cation:proton antiporter n=1 Tax=Algihabitans albus TaxID=2164067 RepID=UPI000E5D897C|nr:cation:proton antiporter family protein [Algihabitans albus]
MEEVITGYLFYEIAAILVLAAAIGFLGLLARQPLIVSFIAVGILVGPSVLDIARSDQHIDLLAELGIAVLLFLVGLKLDLKLVRTLGPVALTTGLGQVLFTSVIGFLLGLALGLDATTSFYVAVALTFSSTIIIVKLLSDKKEIDALHGRIALGFLIVQDLVVVIAMIALSAAGVGAGQETGLADIALVFLSGAALLGSVALFVLYAANPLVERLARAPELLVCFAIGWAALLAAVSHYLGFGKELGGLLAGVSLASTPFREAIAARLASLRDFLLLFFFVALGAGLDLGLLGDNLIPALVLAFFVLIGNPLIVLVIMGLMGYRKRTGFLAGLTVAQISEFSLIFIAVGVQLGHVVPEALGLVTLVGLITISLSTYMITYSHRLYAICEPFLGLFERRRPYREAEAEAQSGAGGQADVLIFGLGRFGGAIAQNLTEAGHRVLGVDFNPASVRYWRETGLPARYGDVTDPELVGHLPLSGVKWVVSAVPDHDTGLTHMDPRLAMMAALRDAGYQGRVALTAHREEDAKRLEAEGADLVLLPFRDAADQAVDLLLGETAVRVPDRPLPEPEGQREFAE